jgi:quercetin dioxygenase-like cupin family protein
MEMFYELESILSTIRKEEYFADFLNTKSIEAGIIRLRKDQKDTQTSHPLDELYYVIKGDGNINIEGKAHRIQSGSVIFVPSNLPHYFYGNEEELLVLYVFSNQK